MRWSVSIGAALVAGAMAWSDVMGVAAPGPNSQQADPNDSVRSVDVELVIAVDVSYSMDLDELAVQREGYAQAIVSKDFLQAMKTGPHSKVAVTYFELVGFERPEDHYSLEVDRRPGIGGCSSQRNHECAGSPRLAHLDLGCDLFRDAAVR
jgi:Protein of unknown function (DUF1194)